MPAPQTPIEIQAALLPEFADILSPEALDFLRSLHQQFNARRLALLQDRHDRQAAINEGELPDFLPQTRPIREGEWQVAPLPPDLLDRRVEITGPVERKMVINALNSGARVFMADFELGKYHPWSDQPARCHQSYHQLYPPQNG